MINCQIFNQTSSRSTKWKLNSKILVSIPSILSYISFSSLDKVLFKMNFYNSYGIFAIGSSLTPFRFLVQSSREAWTIPYSRNFNKFLIWFDPPSAQIVKLKDVLKGYELSYGKAKVADAHSIIIFHKCHAISNGNYITIQSSDIYRTSSRSLFQYLLDQYEDLRKFQQHIFSVNEIFPKELFPTRLYPQDEDEDVPYDFVPSNYV